MAATIIINRLTGAGPTKTNITSANTRASASDSPSPGTSNPVPIPGSGTNYSFWVVTRLECTVAPDTLVNNIKWFTDGSSGLGTGIGLVVATAVAYDQATGTTGTTGDQLTVANYGNGTTDLNDEPVNAFTYDSGSPLSVTGSIGGTGEFGDRAVYQFSVADTASAGTKPAETITWQYDET
jgi:hypothetical protein